VPSRGFSRELMRCRLLALHCVQGDSFFCHPERSEGDPRCRTPRRPDGRAGELAAEAAARHTSAEALLPLAGTAERYREESRRAGHAPGRSVPRISLATLGMTNVNWARQTEHPECQGLVLQHLCAEEPVLERSEGRLQPRAPPRAAPPATFPRAALPATSPRSAFPASTAEAGG
jgi:hypothetical protein